MGPFEEHLRDAIALNQKRLPLYSRISGARSEAVSRWLIFSERLALPLCGVPDRWGKRFNQRGIPIVKEEFLPMSLVPEFQERFPFDPSPITSFVPQSGNRIAANLLRSYRKGGFENASRAASEELRSLGPDLTFHPMLRHLLESVIRVSNLAPLHEKLRVKISLKESTLGLSKWLFFSHFSAFQFATWLDEKASRLHSEGIPILFQDVPSIPAESDFYRNSNTR